MKKVLWLAALLVAGLPASAQQTTGNAQKSVPIRNVKVVGKSAKTLEQVKETISINETSQGGLPRVSL
jgi:hypothetical protein